MKIATFLFSLILLVGWHYHALMAEQGISPEQIYQPSIDLNDVIGTWEILPEDNPLAEKINPDRKNQPRMLMALRKDGTCRIFNEENPTGLDGLWTFEDHGMFITFKDGNRIEFYVYGIKWDFMITRSPIKNGKDQLWSRVR